jgi:1-deoxy-D-xylulose-5-phosphate reductoisomerase
MEKKRTISILGSTGSIGTQALRVVDTNPDHFRVACLTAHRNHALLFEQVRKYRPQVAGIASVETKIPDDLRFCQWVFGERALLFAAGEVPCDDVLVSVVGMVGLQSVLKARETGKRVLLANKEALAAGGHLVMAACPPDSENPPLIPVDSEHSAIFQCLLASKGNPFEKIILTASGGPFRTWTADEMYNAGLEDALKHPNWTMGRKITIDSATMFNKALEIIEAKWLFDARPDQIQVLIHPESIVHSMVVFRDQSVLAQMGVPDMRVPIAFAMAYPERVSTQSAALRLDQAGTLRFEAPDFTKFPALRLAKQVVSSDQSACCILNAANETAANAFLDQRIRFRQIAPIVEETLMQAGVMPVSGLQDVLACDLKARRLANTLIQQRFMEDK